MPDQRLAESNECIDVVECDLGAQRHSKNLKQKKGNAALHDVHVNLAVTFSST